MTTIVTDGVTLAVDSSVTSGRLREPWQAKKVVDKTHEGVRRVYAFAGALALLVPWIAWYEGKRDPKEMPQELGKDVDPGDIMWIWEAGVLREVHAATPYPLEIGYPAATGSGRDFAYGALAVGASPREAVLAAAKYDRSTDENVVVVEL